MVEQEIKKIVADILQISPDEVTPEKSFDKDLGADSLDRVEIVMGIEDKFNIQVPDEALERIQTVRDAIDEIESVIG